MPTPDDRTAAPPEPNSDAAPADDAWRALGLEPGADEEAIQRAYRKLVRRYPPDLAGERFVRIQEAYETLRSPGKLLATARDRPAATLERLFPLSGVTVAESGEPPPRDGEEFSAILAFARHAVVRRLLESLADDSRNAGKAEA